MRFITKQDYINYLENSQINQLREENAKYNFVLTKENKAYDEIKIKEVDKRHDKMFRKILSQKKEVIKFLNQFLGVNKNIKENQIIQCPTDFITKQYREKRSDVIYKLKNKQVYFLIEHQSTIDQEMPFRIYEYVGEIMRKAKTNSIYPIVVPIVIYTGFQKWNVETNLAKKQIQVADYKKYEINLEYNLIAVENYTFEELLKKNTLFSSIMIIEKCKTDKEINVQMNKIIEIIQKPKDKEILSEIVINIIAPLVGKEKANEMLEKINGKEGIGMSPFTKMMFDFQIEKEKAIEEGKAEGKIKAMIEIAKKMIQKDMNMQDIQDVTGLSEKEVKKLKENLVKA